MTVIPARYFCIQPELPSIIIQKFPIQLASRANVLTIHLQPLVGEAPNPLNSSFWGAGCAFQRNASFWKSNPVRETSAFRGGQSIGRYSDLLPGRLVPQYGLRWRRLPAVFHLIGCNICSYQKPLLLKIHAHRWTLCLNFLQDVFLGSNRSGRKISVAGQL